MMYDARKIEALKNRYPEGTRIELISMDDPYTKLKSGDMGTVVGVDDAGQIVMNWDRGSSLSLIPGEDSFKIACENQIDDDEDMEL